MRCSLHTVARTADQVVRIIVIDRRFVRANIVDIWFAMQIDQERCFFNANFRDSLAESVPLSLSVSRCYRAIANLFSPGDFTSVELSFCLENTRALQAL